jgi:hypothetical protein
LEEQGLTSILAAVQLEFYLKTDLIHMLDILSRVYCRTGQVSHKFSELWKTYARRVSRFVLGEQMLELFHEAINLKQKIVFVQHF